MTIVQTDNAVVDGAGYTWRIVSQLRALRWARTTFRAKHIDHPQAKRGIWPAIGDTRRLGPLSYLAAADETRALGVEIWRDAGSLVMAMALGTTGSRCHKLGMLTEAV